MPPPITAPLSEIRQMRYCERCKKWGKCNRSGDNNQMLLCSSWHWRYEECCEQGTDERRESKCRNDTSEERPVPIDATLLTFLEHPAIPFWFFNVKHSSAVASVDSIAIWGGWSAIRKLHHRQDSA